MLVGRYVSYYLIVHNCEFCHCSLFGYIHIITYPVVAVALNSKHYPIQLSRYYLFQYDNFAHSHYYMLVLSVSCC